MAFVVSFPLLPTCKATPWYESTWSSQKRDIIGEKSLASVAQSLLYLDPRRWPDRPEGAVVEGL
jgi:hypothetical protein